MKFIAHRGYINNSKENTIKSFNNAFKDDFFSGIELDVRLSKDNKLVVIHDAFINRVTNASGFVKELNYKELKKYDIPLLTKVLNNYNKKIILVEIKDSSINKEKINKLLNKYKNIYVMSFNKKYINELYNYNRNYKVGYIGIINNTNFKNDFISYSKSFFYLKDYFEIYKNNKELFLWGILTKKFYLENMVYNFYFITDNKVL